MFQVTNTGMQTEPAQVNAASTQTRRASVKSVGMWAFPQTRDCEMMTDTTGSGPSTADISTLTSPLKETPVIYRTFGDTAVVNQDHTYSIPASPPPPDEHMETTVEEAEVSSEEDVVIDVAEVTVCAEEDSSPSPDSSPPFSPPLAADPPSSPPFSPPLAADPLYDPEQESPESESTDMSSPDDETETETDAEKKCYIIFDDCLNELLKHCPTCGAPVLQATKKRQASLLTVDLVCTNMHCTKWNSQAKIRRFAEGNILLAAAVLFSGSTYERFHQLCTFMGLAVPAPSTFYRYQKDFLFPVVYKAWEQERELVKQQLLQQGDVCLIGDGRCDSPGYSAKYGTYTFMDSETKKIVDFEVVQVSEVRQILEHSDMPEIFAPSLIVITLST